MRFLPLFPLNLVVFPGENLNLHIFEPRYRQMIADCEKHGTTFGVLPVSAGKMLDLGTEVRLLEITNRYPNGEMDIKTQGVGIFKVHEFFGQAVGKMYGAGEVEMLEIDYAGSPEKSMRLWAHVRKLHEDLKINKKFPDSTAELSSFDLAHYIGLTLEQEYALLCIEKEEARQDFLLEHLRSVLPVVHEMENLRRRALLNGHFKDITPPQI
jgi:ATP-dependent Lon protease